MAAEYHWLTVLLHNNNIPNFSIEECFRLFNNRNSIELDKYILVSVGRGENQEKQVSFLRLLYNIHSHKPLQGIHQVQIYNCREETSTCWVYSLSSLRHKLLKFEDYLSFERSTFILVPEHKCLVRLKCVRSIVTLPTIEAKYMLTQPILGGPEFASSTPNTQHELSTKLSSGKITSRTESQFRKHLEQIYTSYVRDLNQQVTKKEILSCIRRDVDTYLTYLETIV